jgi:tRNA(Arg) A34 adenosine deaminase TadA
VAQTSEHSKWQLGAVMTRGSTFLGSAPNKFRNHPWINHFHATRHAEMQALRRCLLNSARGSTVYVARVDKMGQTRLARPCTQCMKSLYDAGVREVVYTTNEGCGAYKIERVKDLDTNNLNRGLTTPQALV